MFFVGVKGLVMRLFGFKLLILINFSLFSGGLRFFFNLFLGLFSKFFGYILLFLFLFNRLLGFENFRLLLLFLLGLSLRLLFIFFSIGLFR